MDGDNKTGGPAVRYYAVHTNITILYVCVIYLYIIVCISLYALYVDLAQLLQIIISVFYAVNDVHSDNCTKSASGVCV